MVSFLHTDARKERRVDSCLRKGVGAGDGRGERRSYEEAVLSAFSKDHLAVLPATMDPVTCEVAGIQPQRVLAIDEIVEVSSSGKKPWRIKRCVCATRDISRRTHMVLVEVLINAEFSLQVQRWLLHLHVRSFHRCFANAGDPQNLCTSQKTFR